MTHMEDVIERTFFTLFHLPHEVDPATALHHRLVSKSRVYHEKSDTEFWIVTAFIGVVGDPIVERTHLYMTLGFPREVTSDFQRRYPSLLEAIEGHKHSIGLINELLTMRAIRAKAEATRKANRGKA